MGEFSTRMVWAADHWDVALTQVADGRARLLANIPLDEWIGLGAQYVLELHAEGEGGPEADRTPRATVAASNWVANTLKRVAA